MASLADVAETVLGPGSMSYDLRRAEHEAFLERTFGRGPELLRNIHTGPGTECAIFVGACAIEAGVVAKRGWPKVPAITTWTGLGGFTSRCWLPFSAIYELRRHDVLYWCGGNSATWQAATNGHVGIFRGGSGFIGRTAEGGGGADGTLCKLSDGPKDVRTSAGRPLRGVWRPDLLMTAEKPSEAPAPAAGTPLTLLKGSRGDDVKRVQHILNITADGVFGPQTDGAVRSFQIAHGLTVDGVVGVKTWTKLLEARS